MGLAGGAIGLGLGSQARATPAEALSPPWPELLPILPHDRRRRFKTDADAATLVDIGALGGNAPDNILGGQYRCHQSPP